MKKWKLYIVWEAATTKSRSIAYLESEKVKVIFSLEEVATTKSRSIAYLESEKSESYI